MKQYLRFFKGLYVHLPVLGNRLKNVSRIVLVLCLTVIFSCHLEEKPSFYKHNFHVLTVDGQAINGRITECYYSNTRPNGWTIKYEFSIPESNKLQDGISMGPKWYYSKFDIGDQVKLVYLEDDPRINLEVFYLTNSPYYDYDSVKNQLLNNSSLTEVLSGVQIIDYEMKQWYMEMREE